MIFLRFSFLSLSCLGAAAVFAGTPVEIQVKDDSGAPISRVELILSHQPPPTKFVSLWQGGAHSPKRERIVVKTGSDGVARGEFFSVLGSFQSSDGRLLADIQAEVAGDVYYRPFAAFEAIPANTSSGKGVAKSSCVMRRKINPHAMNDGWGRAFFRVGEKADEGKRLRRPRLPEAFFTEGAEVGFDLVKGSWVSPEGKGEHADLLISVDIEGPAGLSRKQLGECLTQRSVARSPGNEPPELKLTYRFRFAGEGNGVVMVPMAWPPVPEDGLAFPLGGRIPQVAPESGYEPTVNESVVVSPCINQTPFMNYDYGAMEYWRYEPKALLTPGLKDSAAAKQCSQFFLIRRGGAGDKSAYYGVIRGGFRVRPDGFVFHYCINPDSGERNVEQLDGVRAQENLKLFLCPEGVAFKSQVVEWLRPYCEYE